MTTQIQAYQRRAEQQRRDELILSHLPLVKHVIGRLVGDLPSGTDVQNLEASGVLGLVEAAGKFDPTRNVLFKTFAYIRIRGAIIDELRRNSPLPQQVLERVTLIRKATRELPQPVSIEAIAAATGLTADEITDTLSAERFAKTVSWDQVTETSLDAKSNAEDEALERLEAVEQLSNAIQTLPENERTAITLYYKEDLRLREIAEVMKLSVSRISRILTKATFELGEKLRKPSSAA